MEKNKAQISGFTFPEKAPSPWKVFFLKKKILPAFLCRYHRQKELWKLFSNKLVSRYLNFGDFNVAKNGSSQ